MGMDAVARFRVAVDGFFVAVDTAPIEVVPLVEVLRRLVECGEDLPKVEPEEIVYRDSTGQKDACERIRERADETFGWERYYRIESGDGVELMGDLIDDIGDIYLDLRRGLEVFDRSEVDGIWEWWFGFEAHWGVHARNAIGGLKAINDLG